MDETTVEKIARAKDIAAKRACETYLRALGEALADEGLELDVSALHATHHVNEAALIDPRTGKMTVVRAEWMFLADDGALAAAMAGAPHAGTA